MANSNKNPNFKTPLKNFKILIGVIFTLVILGLLSWHLIGQKKIITPQKSLLEQIQEQQEAQGFPDETRSISGKIMAIDGNILTIEAKMPSKNREVAQTPTIRKIIITDSAKLQRMITLPKEKRGDQTVFSVRTVDIKLADIKIGDFIEVMALENIKYKEEITPIDVLIK